jgi:hypothetical protein
MVGNARAYRYILRTIFSDQAKMHFLLMNRAVTEVIVASVKGGGLDKPIWFGIGKGALDMVISLGKFAIDIVAAQPNFPRTASSHQAGKTGRRSAAGNMPMSLTASGNQESGHHSERCEAKPGDSTSTVVLA